MTASPVTSTPCGLQETYIDECVASECGYASGHRPKGIAEQVAVLARWFPGLGPVDGKLAERPLPPGAEGWFAVPRWQAVAPSYVEAVEKVFTALAASRDFSRWHDGDVVEGTLAPSETTDRAFQALADAQGHDILVVAAQFGLRHRGSSMRRVRVSLEPSEFGLGAFAVGIMLLTHPERLLHDDDLLIDAMGDACIATDGQEIFSGAPYFYLDGSLLEAGIDDTSRVVAYCGSATGFVP